MNTYNKEIYTYVDSLSNNGRAMNNSCASYFIDMISRCSEQDVMYFDERAAALREIIRASISLNKMDFLLYAIASSGGCYKKQAYYLGFTEAGFRKTLSRLNNKYSIGSGRLIVCDESTSFYSLSEEGVEFCREHFKNIPINIPAATNQLVDASVLDHASGATDLFYYILGNAHYPATFTFEPEVPTSGAGETSGYLISDARIITYVDVSNQDRVIDYIETHSGNLLLFMATFTAPLLHT
ncbi:MAG: hypothetical protein PHW47_10485 [Lachnospira sp.]|nr:hypothetical protein [Lachnospira sp.]